MATSCTQCRNRKRKCDKQRPTCTCCADRGLECVYASVISDVPQSPLVQELAGIRERLENIRANVNRVDLQVRDRGEPMSVVARSPASAGFGISSASLMRLVRLSPKLSSLLYRLEQRPGPPSIPRHGHVLEFSEDMTMLIHAFYRQVQICYPVLHPGFTEQLFTAKAYGFPSSVDSCLCLLVLSIGFLLLNSNSQLSSRYFDHAGSMLPAVLQDQGVASTQCLILMSIYFQCLARPLQALKYLHLALIRIRALIRMRTAEETSPDYRLVNRLYWIIFDIRSEFSPHLHFPSTAFDAASPSIPLPGSTDAVWEFSLDTDISPSHASSRGEISYLFRKQIELQQLINQQVVNPSVYAPTTPQADDHRDAVAEWCNSLPSSVALALVTKPLDQELHINSNLLIQVRYHAYEASLYWPAVNQILVAEQPDPELLPHCSLFLQSVTNFLAAATVAIRAYPPKTWPLCARYVCSSSDLRYIRG
ncbi:hypothetical protein BJX70DRAFT_352670 [Aspergillus crustosus]